MNKISYYALLFGFLTFTILQAEPRTVAQLVELLKTNEYDKIVDFVTDDDNPTDVETAFKTVFTDLIEDPKNSKISSSNLSSLTECSVQEIRGKKSYLKGLAQSIYPGLYVQAISQIQTDLQTAGDKNAAESRFNSLTHIQQYDMGENHYSFLEDALVPFIVKNAQNPESIKDFVKLASAAFLNKNLGPIYKKFGRDTTRTLLRILKDIRSKGFLSHVVHMIPEYQYQTSPEVLELILELEPEILTNKYIIGKVGLEVSESDTAESILSRLINFTVYKSRGDEWVQQSLLPCFDVMLRRRPALINEPIKDLDTLMPPLDRLSHLRERYPQLCEYYLKKGTNIEASFIQAFKWHMSDMLEYFLNQQTSLVTQTSAALAPIFIRMQNQKDILSKKENLDKDEQSNLSDINNFLNNEVIRKIFANPLVQQAIKEQIIAAKAAQEETERENAQNEPSALLKRVDSEIEPLFEQIPESDFEKSSFRWDIDYLKKVLNSIMPLGKMSFGPLQGYTSIERFELTQFKKIKSAITQRIAEIPEAIEKERKFKEKLKAETEKRRLQREAEEKARLEAQQRQEQEEARRLQEQQEAQRLQLEAQQRQQAFQLMQKKDQEYRNKLITGTVIGGLSIAAIAAKVIYNKVRLNKKIKEAVAQIEKLQDAFDDDKITEAQYNKQKQEIINSLGLQSHKAEIEKQLEENETDDEEDETSSYAKATADREEAK